VCNLLVFHGIRVQFVLFLCSRSVASFFFLGAVASRVLLLVNFLV